MCNEPQCTVMVPKEALHRCGGRWRGGKGCGRVFCDRHLYDPIETNDPSMCERCLPWVSR